jgi:hypothetical protein
MRNGNFSATEPQSYLGPQLYTNAAYQDINTGPTFAKDESVIVNGQIPMSCADLAASAIFKVYRFRTRRLRWRTLTTGKIPISSTMSCGRPLVGRPEHFAEESLLRPISRRAEQN